MRWVVNATPRPLSPGIDPVPILQEAGWAPGPVWAGAGNLAPHRDLITGPSNLQQDAIPTELSRSILFYFFHTKFPNNILWHIYLLRLGGVNLYENGKDNTIQGVTGGTGPDFGRVFLRSYYTDITQNTYIQSSMVTEILARVVWNFDSYYSLID